MNSINPWKLEEIVQDGEVEASELIALARWMLNGDENLYDSEEGLSDAFMDLSVYEAVEWTNSISVTSLTTPDGPDQTLKIGAGTIFGSDGSIITLTNATASTKMGVGDSSSGNGSLNLSMSLKSGVTFSIVSDSIFTNSINKGIENNRTTVSFKDTKGSTETADDVVISYSYNNSHFYSQNNFGGGSARSYAYDGNGIGIRRSESQKSSGTSDSVFRSGAMIYSFSDKNDGTALSFTANLNSIAPSDSLAGETNTSAKLSNLVIEDSNTKITTNTLTVEFDGDPPVDLVGTAGPSEIAEPLFSFMAQIALDAANTITLKKAGEVNSGAGNDTITGSTGNDTIDGGTGADSINGGGGNDTIFAGLGDTIDGGAGEDAIDFSELVDVTGKPITYSLEDRSGVYTVTGTAASMVVTDLASKQTMKFNNVENFIIGGEKVTTAWMLASNSREVTGNDLFLGADVGGEDKMVPETPLSAGISYTLRNALLKGEVDLSFFEADDFSTKHAYDPDQGAYNFKFVSQKANGNDSVLVFTETNTPDKGSRTVSYGLSNTTEGIIFSGKQSEVETTSNKLSLTTFAYKYDRSYSYTDTQTTESKIDDEVISFKAGDLWSTTESSTAFKSQWTGAGSLSYAAAGLTLTSNWSYKDSYTADKFEGERSADVQTLTLASYTLSYKNPDTKDTENNGSISFSGVLAYDMLGKSLDKSLTVSAPRHLFTVTKFAAEDADVKVTTASAVLNLTKNLGEGPGHNLAVWALLHENDEGKITSLNQVKSMLGVTADGAGIADSIWDSANVVTLKRVFEIGTGAGNDTITGSTGNDTIDGGVGADVINGGAGNDTVYAGLGDVIDGGAGEDAIDFSELVDATGKPITYSLKDRSGIYTVTGTATAMVLTDLVSKQTMKFTNVENFIIDGETVSAARMLAPNSRDVTGNELLLGLGAGDGEGGGEVVETPLSMGLAYVLRDVPLAGHVDLSFFEGDDFATRQTYDPDQGTYNFKFVSQKANGKDSVATFTETNAPDKGIQTVGYGLSNATEGIAFSGKQSLAETAATKSGVTTITHKNDLSYSYTDTQASASKADDTVISFKAIGLLNATGSSTSFKAQGTGSGSLSYAQAGLTLTSTWSYKDSYTADKFEGERSADVQTLTLASYTLAYKNPDTKDTANNGSISFSGVLAYDMLGKSLDKSLTVSAPRHLFTVTKFAAEDADVKVTTASAVLDLTAGLGEGPAHNLGVWLQLHENGEGRIEDVGDQVESLLGMEDGAGVADSIWDAANAVTLKRAFEIGTGTGNDTITGSAEGDSIDGGAGADSINGGGGNDSIDGGAGADKLAGGAGADTFVFTAGSSGQTTGFDIISDFTKGAVGVGDVIDYSADLAIAANTAAATANRASINQSTGIATFATKSGTTLADAISDVEAATSAEGEFALFLVNNTGLYHLFISDGEAGVTANDVVVQLVGVTKVSTISLDGGNLTMTA